MKTFKLIGIFAAGFIIGGIAVNYCWGRILSRMTVSKEVDVAAQSAFDAEWLAELRLGETQGVIRDMESHMDNNLFAIYQWEQQGEADPKIRKARDKWLVPVKVYHQSYPVRGGDATETAGVETVLAILPGRNPQSACKSGICRLDDLRLAKLSSKTNPP